MALDSPTGRVKSRAADFGLCVERTPGRENDLQDSRVVQGCGHVRQALAIVVLLVRVGAPR